MLVSSGAEVDRKTVTLQRELTRSSMMYHDKILLHELLIRTPSV